MIIKEKKIEKIEEIHMKVKMKKKRMKIKKEKNLRKNIEKKALIIIKNT